MDGCARRADCGRRTARADCGRAAIRRHWSRLLKEGREDRAVAVCASTAERDTLPILSESPMCILEAMRGVCESLGVPPTDAARYGQALRDNLFPTLELVQAEVSLADALTMGVPLRVAKALLAVTDERGSVGRNASTSSSAPLPVATRLHSGVKQFRVANKKQQNYALRPEDTSPQLESTLDEFNNFMTKKFYNQLEPEIRPATADVYLRVVRLMLGWRLTHAQEQGQARMPAVTAEELGLHHIFSDSSRGSAGVAFNFLEYLRNERGVSASYEANVCRGLVKLAKFVCHDECMRMMDEGGDADGRYPYKTELLTELRKMLKDAQTRQKSASHVSDQAKKWIDWPQLLWCVDQLRLQCTTTTASGNARAPRAVAQAYQRYLIVAILSCVPDRQRTIRELQLGKTLIREKDKWVIKHTAADYKTGQYYGDRAPMDIAPQYTEALDDFVGTWRQHLRPVDDHQYLFMKDNGKPPTADTIYQVVSRAVFKLTGRKTNPHMLRDSIVTHVRGQDVTEKQLEALALYMGHSLAMQKSSYDRRTLGEKVAPAVSLIQSLGSAPASASQDDDV